MKVQAINIATVYYTGSKDKINSKNHKKNSRSNNPSPVHEGLSTAAAWISFGIVLDFISRKITFFKSPTKNSIAMNCTIGTCAGIIAWIKASCSNKNS